MVKNNKVLIFPKNSPWGVIKLASKNVSVGNTYKHVINFPNQTKKDEFINEYLTISGDYVSDYNNVGKQYQIIYKNEFSFVFNTNLEQQKSFTNLDDLAMSDFAVSKGDDGNWKFWILKVISRDYQKITFEAELDIFFTYNVDNNMFLDKTTNYVQQAHMERYIVKNGVRTDKPNWENILKNNLNIPATFQKELKINKDEKDIDKWVIVYLIFNNEIRERQWLLKHGLDNVGIIPHTSIGSLELPYKSLIFPISYNKHVHIGDNPKSTIEILNSIINEGDDAIIDISVIDDLCFDNINNYSYNITQPHKIHIYKLYTDIALSKSITLSKKDYLYIGNLSALKPLKSSINKISTKKDPILLHPNIFKINIEKWNNESKTYGLHQIELDGDKWDIFRCISNISPTNNNIIAWFKPNGNYQETEIINSSYLNISSGDSLIFKTSKLDQYFLNNKNSWENRKNYDLLGLKVNRAQNIAGTIFTGLGTIGAGLTGNYGTAAAGALGMLGGGFKTVQSQISLERNSAMRQAHLDDLKNQTPNYNTGDSISGDIVMGKYIKNINKIKINTYSLNPAQEKILLEQVHIFGYQVNHNLKMKELINTRKRFNYIQAQDVFNVIKLKLSTTLKQIISAAFQDGLTIWHYRDKASWKGFLNYEGDNDET